MKLRFAVSVVVLVMTAALQAADRKLVMIAGPVSHPPLMHEFRAGSMLLQKRLEGFPGLKTVLWYNPIAHVIGEMRSGFYGGYPADYVSYTYVLGIALTLFVIGAYLLRRHTSFLIEQ